jgi:Lrp/AsnC family transcriptional regulator, leucine-responsive regulatory protein
MADTENPTTSEEPELVVLDEKDTILLRELQKNSNRTHKDIAKLVGLAQNSVSDRQANLTKKKVFKRIGAVLDPAVLGYTITAFIFGKFKDGVGATTKRLHKLRDDRPNNPVVGAQIVEIHTLFGEHDVLFKVRARNNAFLTDLVDYIAHQAEITVTTQHVAKSVMENEGIELWWPSDAKTKKESPPE